MPRKKCSFERSDVQAMWNLLISMGEVPVSVKFHKDGTFRIMTEKHAKMTLLMNAEVGTSLQNSSHWDKVLQNGST